MENCWSPGSFLVTLGGGNGCTLRLGMLRPCMVSSLELGPRGNPRLGPEGTSTTAAVPLGRPKNGPLGRSKLGPLGRSKLGPLGGSNVGPLESVMLGTIPWTGLDPFGRVKLCIF